MPLTSSAVDVLGVTTLVLVLLLVCAGIGCVGYVLYFRARVRKERVPALQDFNTLWIVRIILIVIAVLWSLVELLRLPLLRQPNWLLHSLSFRSQGNMCRFYILSSLGFLEPCFFLAALFLVHGSLRSAPFTPRKSWNGKVVALILLFCLPVFLLQLFFVVISPTFEFKRGYSLEKEGYDGKLPSYFTQAFESVTINAEEVAVCRFPLLSSLVLAAFGVLYSGYFLVLGWRMVGVVINKYLQRRLYILLAALLFLLPLHVLLLGLSSISTLSGLQFELLGFFAFITVVLCTTVGEGLLVIQPIGDALAVQWVLAASEFGQDMDIPGEEEPFSVALSMSDCGNLESVSVGACSHFPVSQAGSVHDNDFNSKHSFLRPIHGAGSFSDHNRMLFFRPDSPALPGKPYIPHELYHQKDHPFNPFL